MQHKLNTNSTKRSSSLLIVFLFYLLGMIMVTPSSVTFAQKSEDEILKENFSYNHIPHIILPEQGENDVLKRKPMPDISEMYGFKSANTNDELTVWVRSPNRADMMIEIADLFGKPLISQNSRLNKGENKEAVSIKNLKSGVYLFTVSINGIKYYTGKFSIVR